MAKRAQRSRRHSPALYFVAAGVLFAVFAGVAAGLIQFYLADLPQLRFLEEYRPSTSTRIYDRQDRLIGELFIEKRTPIRLSQISPILVKAILAVEDERFFQHVGVDVKGILRALWADVREQNLSQGGSTITQQLTRGLFLGNEKHLTRKVKEAILAVQIENRYSKEEILDLYLNQIYLGSGVYGVEAAAQKYFGVSAAALDLPQAALIAGLPRAPSHYDPFRNPDRARERRAIVLRRMLAQGDITKEECAAADAAPLNLLPTAVSNQAPYLVELVRQHLEETYGYDVVYRQGLRVSTTLDLDLQGQAEIALREGLRRLDKEWGGWRGALKGGGKGAGAEQPALSAISPAEIFPVTVREVTPDRLTVAGRDWTGIVKRDPKLWPGIKDFSKRLVAGDRILARPTAAPPYTSPVPLALEQEPLVEGALVSLDPRSGSVLAMVGGYDFARSQFNRVMQAHRQPGSGIKPLIYAAAVESGSSASDLIEDEPISWWDPAKKEFWKPQNFDHKFNGPTTLIQALTLSRNIVTIKLLSSLGTSKVTAFIRRIGVQSPMAPNLSLALGTSEVTLLELVSAYSVFPAGGIRADPLFIRGVTDSHGRRLENHLPSYAKVLDPGVAYCLVDMMRSVVNHGTGRIAAQLGYPLGAKTGTTNNYQDAWFAGYAPGLATGVWVGYDDNHSIGRGATGGRVAGPIWTAYMAKALALAPREDFQVPETIVFKEIDTVTGLLAGGECPGGRPVAFIKGREPKKHCSRLDVRRKSSSEVGEGEE